MKLSGLSETLLDTERIGNMASIFEEILSLADDHRESNKNGNLPPLLLRTSAPVTGQQNHGPDSFTSLTEQKIRDTIRMLHDKGQKITINAVKVAARSGQETVEAYFMKYGLPIKHRKGHFRNADQ